MKEKDFWGEDCVEEARAVYENVLKVGGNELESKDIENICSIGKGYSGQKGGHIGNSISMQRQNTN